MISDHLGTEPVVVNGQSLAGPLMADEVDQLAALIKPLAERCDHLVSWQHHPAVQVTQASHCLHQALINLSTRLDLNLATLAAFAFPPRSRHSGSL